MPVGEEIFPEGCKIAYFGNQISALARMLLEEQQSNERNGYGVEHPCYDCGSACEIKKGIYRNEKRRFIIPPTKEEIPLKLKALDFNL